jgi:excisionase family DNA binding protein
MIYDGVELPRLLTRAKAAEVLGIDLPTLDEWIGSGRLDVVRVNGTVRVLAESVADRRGEATPTRANQEL